MLARRLAHRISTKAPALARRLHTKATVLKAAKAQSLGVATQLRAFSSLPYHIKLTMPNLSPTMEKGNIAKWRAKEGDLLQPGDVLAEVETDKATVDFEMQEEGYLAKLLVPEGAKDIDVGNLVAIMVEDEDDVAAFKDFSAGDAPAAAPAPTPAAEEPAQPS